MSLMKDKFFLDTNILVYSFDSSSPSKKEVAKDLIKKTHAGKGCISFQVIQEFLNVATRKFEVPLKTTDAQTYLTKVLYPVCEVFPYDGLYFNALEIMERWKFSFYDSMIIASAMESECTILYSEDMQHNQKLFNLKIVNPFI
ncbi:MAG TPA: PIN domain-containing protein [Tangfeifania sp.]|nr:PIN domain-containing protein [Tangfeifania sp.]